MTKSRWVAFCALFLVTGWLGLAVHPSETVEEEPDFPHGEFEGDCSMCHSPEGWTPVTIGDEFDHAEVSGFALRYSHSQTRCSACHATLDFSDTDPACATCHADVHRAELGADCGRCHSTRSFIDPTTMTNAHLATRFPLRGTHRTLDCEDCHDPGGAGGLQWVNTPTDCLSCHQDAYQGTTNPDHVAGNFPQTCEQCHSSTLWTPAGFNHRNIPPGAQCVDCHLANYQGTTNPDHLANNFPDTCDQCHTTTAWVPANFNHNAIPPGTECVDCHLPNYQATANPDHQAAGYPTTCELCHGTNAWVPATGDGGNHDALYFPIYSGRHNGEWASCTTCHTVPNNFMQFSCFGCHPHSDRAKTDGDHQGEPGYAYDSQACYTCHPQCRMKRALKLLLLVALVALAGSTLIAAEDTSAQVTYVTGSSVYLDVGRSGGLTVGARLTLMRDGAEVAKVEVTEVSGTRAVAKILEQSAPPAVGDTASFAAAPPVETSPEQEPRTKAAKRRGPSGISGRVGVRYIALEDDLNPNSGYSQPALDLRVDGTRMSATPWGFDIDVRARRTYRNEPGAADVSATRAYKFLVSRGRGEDGWRFSLGRQLSPHLAAISIFDGFAADYGAERWGAGVVSGTQPDPIDYGFSSDINEHGFYFRFNGSPTASKQWNVVTGAIGSYAGGEVNREFAYVLGRYRTRRFWAYAVQEIDFNRDWKVDEAGEDSVEPTSTFLSMSVRANDRLTLRAGYDNRRNIRLVRDRVTPATEFDDAFRRGAWLGVTARVGEHFTVAADSRSNDGGSAGSSSTYGGSFGAHRLTSRNVRVFARVARYTNDQIEGLFYQIDAGFDLSEDLRLQARAGRRDDTNLTTIPPENTLNWFGLSLDAFLGSRWYATVEAERTDGDNDEVTQFYTTLTYRF